MLEQWCLLITNFITVITRKKTDYNTLNYLFGYYEGGKTPLIIRDLYTNINNFKQDLQKLKNEDPKIKTMTDLLINALDEKGILFLDVAKYVLRPINSSKDEDFVCLSLDLDSFKKPLEKFFLLIHH